MTGSRMNFNVWIRLKEIFTNPQNIKLSKRLDNLKFVLKLSRHNTIVWKDSFPFIFKLRCLLFGHKYFNGFISYNNGVYTHLCIVCGHKKQSKVKCELKKIH